MILLCALYVFARRLRIVLFGAVTTGRVEGHERRESEDGVNYHPVVTFCDAEGREYRFTSEIGEFPGPRRDVRIFYMPSNPNIAFVASFSHMWLLPVGLALLGAIFIAAQWSKALF